MARRRNGAAAPAKRSGKAPAAILRVELLGRFSVRAGEREVPDRAWRLTKARALVKLLALQPGGRLHRDQALEVLWPDFDPPAAANNLRRTLHAARQALESVSREPGLLTFESGFLTLCPSGLRTDVADFRAAAAAARADPSREAYRQALELFTGALLPDDLYEPWAEAPREELRRLYVDLCLELAQLEESRDEAAAMDALQKGVAADPVNEEAHRRLIRLYARTGQRRQALRQYQEMEAALRDEVDAEPEPASRELHRWLLAQGPPDAAGRTQAPPSPTGPPARRHNLPFPFTSFIGRQREVQEVCALLQQNRLVNLVGPGGSGKTRLAMEVAHTLVDRYRDGVWLVELGDLIDPELVPQAIAAALEVREQPARPLLDTLARSLVEQERCLVLDNCEHLISACAGAAHTLLQASSGLTILATSRQALGIIGEALFRVPPLAHPEPDVKDLPLHQLARIPAVHLFIERAQQVHPSFRLTSTNASAVASICARLDGMPLAIELAAARVKSLTPEELLAQMDDRFGLLTRGSPTAPERHQTLRATVSWSYRLLDYQERTLLRRLAVFAGGWTLPAAQEVCADPKDAPDPEIRPAQVLDVLGGLLDKSWVLVKQDAAGGTRYWMLETLREYAAERLQESTEAEALERRHALWFLALAEQAVPTYTYAGRPDWLPTLRIDEENLRAALRRSLHWRAPHTAMRFGAVLWRFWYGCGQVREGVGWLEAALALVPEEESRLKAEVLFGASALVTLLGNIDRTQQLAHASLSLSIRLHDYARMAPGLAMMCLVALRRCQYAEAVEYVGQALDICRQGNSKWAIGMCLGFLAAANEGLGEHDRARQLLNEALPFFEAAEQSDVGQVYEEMARAALSRGNAEWAAECAARALEIFVEKGDPPQVSAPALTMLAAVDASARRLYRAARLTGAADAMCASFGAMLDEQARGFRERTLQKLGEGLRSDGVTNSLQQGRSLDARQAVAYALGQQGTSLPKTHQGGSPQLHLVQAEVYSSLPWSALTGREQEVALLMAQGLSNRDIASALIVSEGTVRVHVRHVLHKLGLLTRTRVAAWAAHHGLLDTSAPPTQT